MIKKLLPLLVITLIVLPQIGLAVPAAEAGDNGYVGAAQCQSCHQRQYSEWQGSHHQMSMLAATVESVLGDFDDAQFNYNGVTTTFFKKNDEYWVNTDGKDGELHDYRIGYTFGVQPLQQYLIAFADGRLQALNIAWDSRPETQGGQRWFHLYPDEKVHSGDVLHWTAYSHNWNSRCADCHSTNLQKSYDANSNTYDTSWSEINVACEACHGPAAGHISWAQSVEPNGGSDTGKGFTRKLDTTTQWRHQKDKSTASAYIAGEAHHGVNPSLQVSSCAACHSRRARIDNAYSPQLLDQFVPRTIEAGLYHADGQILDEVFVYGSFAQSKMFNSGVVCTDCHNPHNLELKLPGNAVCAQCHNPSTFDSKQHHHHETGSQGAECANCHMPATTYMVVDPRRDHSLRVPRPDLSKTLGTPNACNQCHQDQSVAWANKHFENWYPDRVGQPHYGEALARQGTPGRQSLAGLLKLVNDDTSPAISRASALQLLRDYPGQDALNTASTQLHTTDPLLRLAAVRAVEMMPREQRPVLLWRMLDDPVKAVRLEATRLLAGVQGLDATRQTRLQESIDEAVEAWQLSADAPTAQINLGVLYTALNQPHKALAAYRTAQRLEPQFIPAYVNQADVYRALGQEEQALQSLREGLDIDKNNADANFSMGLLMVRKKQLQEALGYLFTAVNNGPDESHYAYVYAVALYESGKQEQAITTLKNALQRHPDSRDIRDALQHYLSRMGRAEEAKGF